jgi:hypothetical protein
VSRVLVSIFIASFALALPTSSLAAKEFMKVGNSIQIEGGDADLAVPSADVSCEGSKGTGAVVTATQVKAKVTFEKCTSFFGEKEVAVKVSTCNVLVTANEATSDAVSLESGCVLESEGCVIEPSGNKELKEGGYVDLKETEGELESEFAADVSGLTYTVNFACELAGIHKGKEGLFFFNTTVKGADAQTGRRFKAEGAEPAKPRVFELDNTNTHVIKFTGTTNIECGEVKLTGETTAVNNTTLHFTAITYSKCTSNIVPPRQNITLTANSSCEYQLSPFADSGTFRGVGSIRTRTGTCEFKAEINSTCKVIFFAGQSAGGILFSNVTGPPKTVNVKFTEGGASDPPYVFQYHLAPVVNACGGSIPFQSTARYKGAGTIKAKESGGPATNIEVG